MRGRGLANGSASRSFEREEVDADDEMGPRASNEPDAGSLQLPLPPTGTV